MNGIQLTISLSAFAGVIFTCGILFDKINNHTKRLNAGDKKLEAHSEAVTSMKGDIKTLTRDVGEIKGDVKEILRNNKK